jgi:hypothetical protein
MKITAPAAVVRFCNRHIVPALDAYSDWAARPTGPNLSFMRWRYRVLWRDWVSTAQVLLIALALMWWTGGGLVAFGIGVAIGVLSWVVAEAWLVG